MLLTIISFIIVLSVLVLVHEFGHFFVAKKLGIKVEEFGFGFPPRILSVKYGETIYSINLLPVGGFVKLYGEDEAGAGKISLSTSKNHHPNLKDQKRAFFSRPAWQRAIVVVAGVIMNFFLAVVIITYLFTFSGVPVPGNNVVIAAVVKNSPAAKAGLTQGDIALSINGIKVISPDQLVKITKMHLGQAILLKIKDKKNIIKNVVVMPRISYPKNEGAMGIAIGQNIVIKKYPWYQAPFLGVWESMKDSWLIIAGIKDAIAQVIITHKAPAGLAGPVGIAQITGQFIQIGFDAVLSLVAMLSLNLAVLNILPIPALDGGRLFFILTEIITRRKVHPKFEAYAHTAGMVLLLALVALITYHDIVRAISGQPVIP